MRLGRPILAMIALLSIALTGCPQAEPTVEVLSVEGAASLDAGAEGLNPVDPEYIQLYPAAITTELSLGRADLSMELKEPEGESLRLQTNPPAYVGLSASWGFMGLGVSFATSPGAEEQGDTDNYDFRWTWYGRNLTLDVMAYDYSGFYYEDDAQNIELFEDLHVNGGSITLTHAFNERQLSQRAVFRHTERQKQSAGSWFVFGSGSGMSVSTPDTMIPASRAGDFTGFKDLNQVSFLQLAVGGGYGHTWVWGTNWYFHASGRGGVGFHQYDYNSDKEADGADGFFRGIFRASLGYNGQKYYYGLSGMYDTFSNGMGGGALNAAYNRVYAFGGMRF